MRFQIERTSDWIGEKSPCEGAVLMRKGTSIVDPVYIIDIASLEDLVKLMEKEGEIIIKEGYKGVELPVIEIYDTYRE